jgi:glycosyltransferase involved in cell wall biosynthesis
MTENSQQKVRVAYIVTHPIQYQAPLLRYISSQPDIDLTVFFQSDLSVKNYFDPGFGRAIAWDVPLLEGYRYEFLPVIGGSRELGRFTPINYGIAKRLIAGKFDVLWVHGYARWFNWIALVIARFAGIPALVRDEATQISSQRHPLKVLLKRRLFFPLLGFFVSGFLAIGRLNRAYYEANGIARQRIFLTPYCVDNEYFRKLAKAAEAAREELRASLDVQPGRPIILYASKLQRRKRPDDLLNAFLQLRGRASNAHRPYLLFVGDGEMLPELTELAKPAGDDVRFLGFRNQSELPAFFDLCDVFVLPSEREPWGLIVNEVMCAGRPVIVSDDVGCGPDLVRNGINGFIYPAGDIAALAKSVEDVLGSAEVAASMGAASRSIIDGWSFAEVLGGLREAIRHVTRKP